MRRFILGLASVFASVSSDAQSSISGDVFVVVENGVVRPAAGAKVRLLQDTPAAKRIMQDVCDVMPVRRIQEIPAALKMLGMAHLKTLNAPALEVRDIAVETIVAESVLARMSAIADSLAIVSTAAGISGHFTIDSAAPGNYALYSEWVPGSGRVQWFRHISVAATGNLKADLGSDFSTIGFEERSPALFCKVPPAK